MSKLMLTKRFYQSKKRQELDWNILCSYKRTLKRLRSLLNLKTNDIILDVGCGAGNLAIPLLKYSTNIIGVGISHDNIHCMHACARENLEIVIADAERLSL